MLEKQFHNMASNEKLSKAFSDLQIDLVKGAHASHKYLRIENGRYIYDHSKMSAADHKAAFEFHKDRAEQEKFSRIGAGGKEKQETNNIVKYHEQLADTHVTLASQKEEVENHSSNVKRLLGDISVNNLKSKKLHQESIDKLYDNYDKKPDYDQISKVIQDYAANDRGKTIKEEAITQSLNSLKHLKGSSKIEKAFDDLETDVIEKAFTGQGLVKKKVTIHGHNGKVYEGYRYVSTDTGMPVDTSVKETSKETKDFKQKKAKELSSAKTPEDKQKVEAQHDEDFANKIKEISEGGGTKSKRIRDLVDLGVYDTNLILQLNPDCNVSNVMAYLKEGGIDPKKFQDHAVKGINIALGKVGGHGVGTDPDAPVYELQKELKDKDLRKVIEAKKQERAKAQGITSLKKMNLYRFQLENLIELRNARSLLVYGTGGIGKTYNLEKALEAAGKVGWDPELDLDPSEYDYVKITGNSTPSDIYNLMYENPRKLIIFDDCDSMWDNDISANLLKGALDTSGDGRIRYSNPKKLPDGTTPPQTFKFNGQIIFISNLPREKFPQPIVDSRATAIDLTMNMDQTIELLDSIKGSFKFKNADREEVPLPPQYMDDIIHLIKEFKNDLRIEQVNGRVLQNLSALRAGLAKKGLDDYDTFKEMAMIQLDLA